MFLSYSGGGGACGVLKSRRPCRPEGDIYSRNPLLHICGYRLLRLSHYGITPKRPTLCPPSEFWTPCPPFSPIVGNSL